MSLIQPELQQLIWRKSRRSMNNGDCVEVAPKDGNVFVRDSKDPHTSSLAFSAGAWRNFLAETKRDSIG